MPYVRPQARTAASIIALYEKNHPAKVQQPREGQGTKGRMGLGKRSASLGGAGIRFGKGAGGSVGVGVGVGTATKATASASTSTSTALSTTTSTASATPSTTATEATKATAEASTKNTKTAVSAATGKAMTAGMQVRRVGARQRKRELESRLLQKKAPAPIDTSIQGRGSSVASITSHQSSVGSHRTLSTVSHRQVTPQPVQLQQQEHQQQQQQQQQEHQQQPSKPLQAQAQTQPQTGKTPSAVSAPISAVVSLMDRSESPSCSTTMMDDDEMDSSSLSLAPTDHHHHPFPQQLLPTHDSDGDDDDDDDEGVLRATDVFFLIESQAWDDVINFVRSFPESAHVVNNPKKIADHANHDNSSIADASLTQSAISSSQPSIKQSKSGGFEIETGDVNDTNDTNDTDPTDPTASYNYALHEVCKYEPPLDVVDVLLFHNQAAVEKAGADGYLPLHVACAHQSSADVVSRLLEVHCMATRIRSNTQQAYPLHLAAKHAACEEVIIDLLTHHPDAWDIADRTGLTPMDHAINLPSTNSNRDIILSTLGFAPVIVAASEATQRRLAKHHNVRLRGLQQAHHEFVRQLEHHHKTEQSSGIRNQLQIQNDLADEKDRNIMLAEALLKQTESQQHWEAHKQAMERTIEQQDLKHAQQMATQEKEYQSIIDDAVGRVEDLQEQLHDFQHTKMQLKDLQTRYEEIEQELLEDRNDEGKKQKMIDRLQELLAAKETQIQGLREQLENNETAQLAVSRLEMKKMREHSDHLQHQLLEANRKIAVSDHRLTSIKNQVAALTYNLQSWAMDDEWEQQKGASPKAVVEGIETVYEQQQPQQSHSQSEQSQSEHSKSHSQSQPQQQSQLLVKVNPSQQQQDRQTPPPSLQQHHRQQQQQLMLMQQHLHHPQQQAKQGAPSDRTLATALSTERDESIHRVDDDELTFASRQGHSLILHAKDREPVQSCGFSV